MAHDIRTPLTVMAGYLELMQNKEYSSQEELDEYIRISAEKAEQLRTMSDKMFRYFYVYSKGGEDLNMEMFPAGPFLDQMLGSMLCSWARMDISSTLISRTRKPKFTLIFRV